jgi:hypothetical protein
MILIAFYCCYHITAATITILAALLPLLLPLVLPLLLLLLQSLQQLFLPLPISINAVTATIATATATSLMPRCSISCMPMPAELLCSVAAQSVYCLHHVLLLLLSCHCYSLHADQHQL